MYASVKNGTNAGWRKPGDSRPKSDWSCCGHVHRYFYVKCPKCGGHRV